MGRSACKWLLGSHRMPARVEPSNYGRIGNALQASAALTIPNSFFSRKNCITNHEHLLCMSSQIHKPVRNKPRYNTSRLLLVGKTNPVFLRKLNAEQYPNTRMYISFSAVFSACFQGNPSKIFIIKPFKNHSVYLRVSRQIF